jgi:hypothetical protein
MGSSKKNKEIKVPNVIDPLLVKAWNRKLGILFYSSELSEIVQNACETSRSYSTEQLECNRKVDDAVLGQSDIVLGTLDKRYKKLNDDIANFLEAQGNFMAVCLTNIGT